MDETNRGFLEHWTNKGSTSGNITVTATAVAKHPSPMVLATIPMRWLTSSEPTFDWAYIFQTVQMSVVQPGYLCNKASELIDMSTTPQAGAYLLVPLAQRNDSVDQVAPQSFTLSVGPISK